MLSSRVVQVIRQFSKTAPVRKVHDVHEYNGPGSVSKKTNLDRCPLFQCEIMGNR